MLPQSINRKKATNAGIFPNNLDIYCRVKVFVNRCKEKRIDKMSSLINISPAAISVNRFISLQSLFSGSKTERHLVEVWGVAGRHTFTRRCKWTDNDVEKIRKIPNQRTLWNGCRMMKNLPHWPFNIPTTSHNGNVLVFSQKQSISYHILGFTCKKRSVIFLPPRKLGDRTHTSAIRHIDPRIR